MSRLNDLLEALHSAREAKASAYEAYKLIVEGELPIKEAVEWELKKMGLITAKTDNFTVTIASRQNFVINNEKEVIDWINKQEGVQNDLYVGIKKTAFDGLAKSVLINTGEVIAGTEIVKHEYLSLRNNKKGEKQ